MAHVPKPTTTKPCRVLVSSVASDAHTWNLVFLHLLIEEHGHEVLNLGACVPVDLLVTACLCYRPHVVVLSTINGHGYMDGLRAIRALRHRRELDDLHVVIGGKLGVRDAGEAALAEQLCTSGFDAVFTDADFDAFRRFLAGGVRARVGADARTTRALAQ